VALIKTVSLLEGLCECFMCLVITVSQVRFGTCTVQTLGTEYPVGIPWENKELDRRILSPAGCPYITHMHLSFISW